MSELVSSRFTHHSLFRASDLSLNLRALRGSVVKKMFDVESLLRVKAAMATDR